MRNPELKIYALLALGLAGGCWQSADAQTAEHRAVRLEVPPPPPSLPPLPKAQAATARPVARPREMPCAITSEDRSGSDTMKTTYRLYYRRQDGRLGLATEQTKSTYCRSPPCLELPGREEVVLRYEYDADGRLAVVKRYGHPSEGRGSIDRMTLTYSVNRLERYIFVEGVKKNASRSDSKVVYDDDGLPIATWEKGRMWMAGPRKTQTTTSLKDCREPFRSSPVVWPVEPEVLYLGWSSRVASIKIEGLDPGYYKDEYSFRPDGRLMERSTTLNGYTDKKRWNFEYSCGEERAAEEVNLEAK